jgi:hypothetical protein
MAAFLQNDLRRASGRPARETKVPDKSMGAARLAIKAALGYLPRFRATTLDGAVPRLL